MVSIVLVFPKEQKARLKEIQKCLQAVEKHTPEPHEIIIACASPEGGTANWLRKQAEKPGYKFVGDGGGFSVLANGAIAAASGEYVILLEGGAEVSEGWLTGMMECLENAGKSEFFGTAYVMAGSTPVIVGPMSNRAEGMQKILLPEESGGKKEAGDWQEQARALRERNAHCRFPVQLLDNFCLLFPHALFEKTGGFDEHFGSRQHAVWDFIQRSVLDGARCFAAAGTFIHRDWHGAGEEKSKAPEEETDKDKTAFEKKWNSLDPLGPEARKLRALKLAEEALRADNRGDLQTAVGIFVEAVRSCPLDDLPFKRGLCFRFARMLIEDGQYKQALEVLSNMPAGDQSPQEPDAVALELTGYCRDGLGEIEEAERLARRALKIDRRAGALNLLGLILFRKGEKENAVSFFEEAIKADGGYAEAYGNLGAVRWAEGKKEEALSLFERAFAINPAANDMISNYYSAVMELSKSDAGIFEKAVPVVREAVSFFPAKKRLRHILAEFYFRSGRSKEALEVFEDVFLVFGVDDAALSIALQIRDIVCPKPITAGNGGRKKEKTLSMCMIVKNEGKNIVRALLNLRPLSDEMIVVDTGSSDRTKDIARALGAKAFDFPWTGDFSAARNFSIEKASGDWILVMDADEAIAQASRKALRSLLKGPEKGYIIVTRNYVLSPGMWGWRENDGVYSEQAGTGWIGSAKVRLFPNDARIRFRNQVHELVEDSVREAGMEITPCDIPVHHYGKLFPEKVVEKGKDYFELGKAKLAEKGGTDLKAAVELAVQCGEIGRPEDGLEAWRKVVEINPGFSGGHIGIAHSLYCLGRYREAIEAVDKGFKSPFDVLETSYLYANCLVLIGEEEKAVRLLENSGISHPMVLSSLAVACLCSGRKEQARELAGQASRFMDMGGALFMFAKMLINAGRMDSAIRVLEYLVEEGRIGEGIPALLAKCYVARANRKAKEALEAKQAGAVKTPGPAANGAPRVSVIMPSYNYEMYVSEQIQSILDQTFSDFEFLIIENGSTDFSLERIKKFDDPRIKLSIYWKNSRNVVNDLFKKARGEFVALVHADDVCLPDKLEKQVAFLDGHPEAGAVFTYAQIIDGEGRETRDPFNHNLQPNRTRYEWLNYLFNKGCSLFMPSLMIRKDIYDKVGPLAPWFGRTCDFDYWIRLCLGHDIHIIQEKLLKYRLHGKNDGAVSAESIIENSLELPLIFRRYLAIKSVEEFMKVFPEAERYNVEPARDLLPYLLARLALDTQSPFLHSFGINTLFSVMEDGHLADYLSRHCSFDYDEFLKLVSRYDIYNKVALIRTQQENNALRAKIRSATGPEKQEAVQK